MMNTDTFGPQRSARTRLSSTSTGDAGSLTRRSQPLQARFRVEGLSCDRDAVQLEHRLNRQVGVIGVSVNTITDFAYIAYDPSLTSLTLLQRHIEISGFTARPR